jgi:hypothetical protein
MKIDICEEHLCAQSLCGVELRLIPHLEFFRCGIFIEKIYERLVEL